MKPRKPPQFSLGSLLWLMLSVAVVGGWYVDRTRLNHKVEGQAAEVQQIRQKAIADKAHFDQLIQSSLAAQIAAQTELDRLRQYERRRQELEENLLRRIRHEREIGLLLRNR